jgi:site-specific DNA-methyltransferase (adenine-specific)
LEILPTLADKSVDAVITDPPYSSGGAFRSDRTNNTASKYLGSYNSTNAGKFDEVVGDNRDSLGWAFWATLWMSQCYKVLKDGGYCMVFTDWRQLPNLTNVFQAAGFVWRGIAVWDKGGSVRPMSGRFAHQAEYVVWGSKGAIGWDFDKQWNKGVYQSMAVSAKQRNHQTEKPVDVIEWLLGVTEEGATILDPFTGSGTTAVACWKAKRNFIGCEISHTYYEIAQRRIREAQQQMVMEL